MTQVFPSKYLKSTEIESDLPLTIRAVSVETVGQGAESETKPVLSFDETDKQLVLNRTNCDTIISLHGPDSDKWIGQRVTLFSTEVDFKGKQTLAIRIRMKRPSPGGANAAAPVARTAATPAEDLAAAKRDAFRRLQELHPGKQPLELKDIATAAAASHYNCDVNGLGADQWQRLTKLDFKSKGEIIPAAGEFTESDIPF